MTNITQAVVMLRTVGPDFYGYTTRWEGPPLTEGTLFGFFESLGKGIVWAKVETPKVLDSPFTATMISELEIPIFGSRVVNANRDEIEKWFEENRWQKAGLRG